MKKWLWQGRCPWTPTSAYAPWTLRTCVMKKRTSQPTIFAACASPKCNQFTLAFYFFLIIKTKIILTYFSKIKACMGVKYFLVCVRKHKSNLSTNIRTTVGKKTQWSVEKCELLSETTFSPYFMTVWCVFFYQIVCFFYQWCLSCFSSQHYVSMIFVKQCW